MEGTLTFLQLILKIQRMIAQQFPFQGYDWSNAQFLGEGSYGKVFRVFRTTSHQFVAVKQINMEKILHDNLLDSLKGQIDIMKEVASPYTVRLFDSSIGGQWSYMILELCDSDLRKEMEKNGQCFPQNTCLEIFGEILKGMKVLVDHSFIHRDIKPANVLYQDGVYKIADYGFARKADIYGNSKLDQFCGTPIYMAPQLLCQQPYTAKCDIWSLGLMLYQLLFGCPPWPCLSLEGYIESIKRRPLSFPYNQPIGSSLRNFLIRALTVNEDLRMSWAQLFANECVHSKNGGNLSEPKKVDPKAQAVLSHVQTEIQRRRIDVISIFSKYQQYAVLEKNQFFALMFDISPTLTTYQSLVLFDFADNNKNGIIQFNEFKELFCTNNFHEDPKSAHLLEQLVYIIQMRKIDVHDLFNHFDSNNSGSIDAGQFRNFIRAIIPKCDTGCIQRIQKLFDQNGNGLINKREFIEKLSLPSSDIDLEQGQRNLYWLKNHMKQDGITVEKFLSLCDRNMDGKIEENEFLELMNKITYGIKLQEIKAMFRCIDLNNSGVININELIHFLQ